MQYVLYCIYNMYYTLRHSEGHSDHCCAFMHINETIKVSFLQHL